ncbi:MAG: hypothetical protein E7047_02120, partial [Lentisphaerae bacterium]|nr:hypothetical protein [Lentisphaerota bacterium]
MATLYVNASWTAESCDGKTWGTDAFSSINDAIAAAAAGDTVEVAAGNYISEGAIVITKTLTVKAADGAEVIVDHVELGSSYSDAATDYMTVQGLTIKPQTYNSGDWHYSGVWQNSRAISDITVQDCVFDFSTTPDSVQNVGVKMSRSAAGDGIKSVTITGCTFNCSEKTANAVTMGDKGAIESINISNNIVNNGCTSSAIHMDMGFQNSAPVEITITGNEISNVGKRGIMIANVQNDEADITITGNTVDGAGVGIHFYNTCTNANSVTIADNTISNVTTGMDLTYIATESTNTVSVTDNNITITSAEGNSAFAGYTPADGANTVTLIEAATSIAVDAALTGNDGDIVAINGKNYIIGTNAFANLTDAVNAASATEATTITVASGTYNEDITLDARTMEQKGNIKFVAAEGADVTFTGLFTLGYYEKRVGSKKWNADVTFENITFDQAADAKHSIDIQQCNDFAMINCKVVGYGEYGISGTNVDNGATITGTTFENAAIQSAGSFGTNMLIDGCTFNESRVNIQSGNSVTVMNSVFNNTLTDANVGDSFYCIRSNDNAIILGNNTFNIDSALTEVAADQAKWGVLWQRNAGGTQWKAFNCQFNLTDAAMLQTELLVNKNGTTNAANEAGRVMIYAFNSKDNEVADLLARTEGTVNVVADGRFATYNNGAIVGEAVDVSKIYIDNRFTADNVGELTLGVNAFTTIDDKVMATAAAAKSVITVKEGAEVVIDKTITNTIMHKDTQDWYYTDYLRTDGYVADVNVDGTLKTYHLIVNNADTVVSTTGRVRTDEDLRIVGGTLTVNGNRNGETADELYTGSWGNDIEWTDATQVKVSYFKVVYGAEAVLNNTNVVVWAQSVDVGAYWTATADNPSTGKLTLNNSYMVVGDWNTITVGENSVLNLTNNSTIQADNDANSNFLAKMVLNGTLNLDADSRLALGSMTIGENGMINIDAAGLTGTQKLIDLSGTASLEGKVNLTNAEGITAIYGADGDVTLTDADLSVLYVNADFTPALVEIAKLTMNVNAFTSMAAALKAVTSQTERIEVSTDITESIAAENTVVTLSKDLEIKGTGNAVSNVTMNDGGYKTLTFKAADGVSDIDVKFTNVNLVAPKTQVIFGGAEYAADGSVVNSSPVTAEIDGSSTVSAYVVAVEADSTVNVLEGGKFCSTGEVMNIKGTLNAAGNAVFNPASDALTAADRQIVAHYMWNYGTVALTDTYATIYSQLRLRDADAEFVADNALIELGKKVDGTWLSNPSANGVGWIKIDGGSMALTNNSKLLSNGATGRDGYGLTIAEGAELKIESGSYVEFSAGISNAGAITVDNATLKVGTLFAGAGTQPPATDLANSGTIEVSGESTLDIANLTGSTITALDGATLKDSTIASTGSVELVVGGSGVASTVTFEGDNKIAKIAAGDGDKIVVGKGASLELTGARSAFGGGAEWDIDGEIVDAKAVTAEEKAELKASLNLAQGLSVSETNGKESVMNVDNAYVTWGREVTTKNTNSANGKLTLNFTNSIVDGAGKIAINPTKAGYDAANAPEVEMNFKDSVVKINNYFTNNHAKGTVTIDNTNFTATAFGNVGEFSVTNGSVVNFALVNNGLNDWAGKGSLNAGTMTIDASSLNIVNKTATLEFYNVGSITLSNGASFTLNQFVNAQANDLTGSGNINTTFADMAGSITIDAASLLTVTGKFVNNSTITVDGSGFTGGFKKVIELSGTESLKGTIQEVNIGEGVRVIYGADGDVALTDADMSVLFVDAAFSGEFGADLGDGKIFGVNAFATLTDAVKAQTADTTAIEVASDVSEVLSGNTYSGNITAAEGKEVVIADSANSNYANVSGMTLGKGVTLDSKYFYLYGENTFNGNVKSSTTFYSSGKLTLTGNAEVYTTMSRYYAALEDGIYVVGSAAAGEGKNATVQYKSINYLGHYSGTFSVKDTAAEFGYILLNGSNDGDIQARLVLDNAKVSTIGGPNTQPGQVQMNDDAAIIATNDSVLDFRGPKDFGYLSMGANNSISLTDSEMYLGKEGQGTNTLAGKITLVNSTLNSLGKLSSTATITMDASSSIVATAITGGTITINAKGYTGDSIKLIDLDQNGKLTNVTLTNSGNNYYLTYGDDGDVTLTKAPEFIYVSSDYNSSTEGWGVTRFANYDSAVNFIKNNARKATMVIEKTITLSGNCFADSKESLGVDLTNTVIVKDGAVMGNAQSKWDMTYAVTIEGGGILQSARPSNAGIGNTHIKNKLTIGDGSDKQAKVLFINGKNGVTYKTMSIALLSGFNRSLTANNALIEVGDLGIQATASFTDTTLTIDGILAIKGTSLYKTTMTDTEVTIKGHNLMNENTYYSTVGTILATLTMDNSSIVVDDGNAETVAEKVWLGYTGNVAQTLTMTNGSSITVEKGAEVAVGNKVVMSDSSITAGNINAGATKAANSSFYFNQLEKGKVYYAVLYDAEGNELETIVRTSTSGSTFYPKFSVQPVGDYTAKCFKDEAKTELHQSKTYQFTAVGSLELTNSDLYAEKLTLAGNNVTMDIASTIGFASIEGGYITVSNLASYVDNAGVNDGNYKLFDYTGSGAMTEDDYKALLNNVWHDNYKVINNDLFLTDQDTNTIYVNAEWAGNEFGDTVGAGYLYGYNAAASLKEIGSMINTDGSDTIVKFESDIEAGSVAFNYGAGDITFTADKAVTIKQNAVADWDFVVGDVDSTITIGENVTFQIYENASGMYVYYGAGLKIEGTLTGGANWGCAYLAFGDHSVEATGTLSTGRVHMAWSTLTVNGDAASDRTDAHVDTNYLLVEDGVFTADNAIIKAGAVHDSNNGGLRYDASEFNINDSDFTANTVTLKHADTKFNVTGTGSLNIGTLTGTITLDEAELTASAINKGSVNFKGENTFAGDFKADYAYVGDWNNEEYDGSVDFGTAANVKVGGQMIIGYDTLVAGANNVVFGDVTGAETTDKTFVASDVSVRRDGTLTIANTTGENKISTMNVMGSVIVDNAKLSMQIGGTANGIMTVKNGAEVNIGGSSNSVVVLGKSAKGTLNVDNATVTVKRCGAGASYKVPADTFVIGYNGGIGELNVSNNGTFVAADYNGDKDGGQMNVQLNDGSVINAVSGGKVDIAGNVNNAGSVNVNGGAFSAGSMDLKALLTIDGLTAGAARDITVAIVKQGASSGTTVTVSVAANATSAAIYLDSFADGNYNLTIIDGGVATAAVALSNGKVNVEDGMLNVGAVNINKGAISVAGASDISGIFQNGKVDFADNAVLTSTNGAVFDNSYTFKNITFGNGSFTFNGLYADNAKLTSGADVAVTGTFALWDNDSAVIEAGATLTANSIYFNGGSIELSGKINTYNSDGGLILNGAGDTITVKAGAEINAAYVDAYKNSADSTVDVYGSVTIGHKVSDGSGKFTWNVYEGGSLTANKYGVVMGNADSAINLFGGTLTVGQMSNAGTLAMDVNSQVIFSGSFVNSGIITIDMSDVNNAIGNKLFDRAETGWTIDDYKSLIGSSWTSEMDKFLSVDADGDLIIRENAVAYVNGSYTDAGKNQFATHEEAVESGAGRIITLDGVIVDSGDYVSHEGAEAVVDGGTFNATISGAGITQADNKNWDDTEYDSSLVINDGIFNKMVIGANRVNGGNSEHVGNVDLTINGGTFNAIVTAGAVYVEKSVKGQAIVSGDINLTIAGGSFSKFIYGGNSASLAAYSSRTVVDGNINITVDASQAIEFTGTAAIVAGSYQSGVVEGNVSVKFTGNGSNLTMHDTFEVWGGCSADVYLDDADRTFQTQITGSRTFTFDAFTGDFAAKIRGFETLVIAG